MKVLSIIVTYNGLHWMDRCLGSLRDSQHPTSVVVIDNGSTDGTVEHIRAHFPEVELVVAPKNLGFGQANNVGLRMALDRNMDHVFLLNQDSWVQPDTIGRLVELATTHPDFGILSPLHLTGKGDALDREFAYYLAPDKCPGILSDLALRKGQGKLYEVDFVNAAAWLVTRACLLQVGGFDPTFFHYSEDDNYLHRAHYHGFRSGIVTDVYMHHDREDRKSNPYFDQLRVYRVRALRLRYADPGRSFNEAAERRALWWKLVRGLLALRKKEVLIARDHLKLFNEADLAPVLRNRAQAQRKGATFL